MLGIEKLTKNISFLEEKLNAQSLRLTNIEKLIESIGGQISQGNGSRVRFKIGEAKATFHRPHPSPDTNKLTVKDIRDFLIVAGVKLE